MNDQTGGLRWVGRAHAVELGLLSASVVLILLVVTTLWPHKADGACLLPMMARAMMVRADNEAGLVSAIEACEATREDAMAIWNAHVEAERIEGLVPKRMVAP